LGAAFIHFLNSNAASSDGCASCAVAQKGTGDRRELDDGFIGPTNACPAALSSWINEILHGDIEEACNADRAQDAIAHTVRDCQEHDMATIAFREVKVDCAGHALIDGQLVEIVQKRVGIVVVVVVHVERIERIWKSRAGLQM